MPPLPQAPPWRVVGLLCFFFHIYWGEFILVQGDTEVPVHLHTRARNERNICLKEGSGRGHSHVTHKSHAPPRACAHWDF
jgi:hypothetical protein